MPCVMKKAQWALNWINPQRVSCVLNVNFSTFLEIASLVIMVDMELTAKKINISDTLLLKGILWWEDSRLCCCGRNLFLWVICCHFLAEKEGVDARTHILEWAHQPWWGKKYFSMLCWCFSKQFFSSLGLAPTKHYCKKLPLATHVKCSNFGWASTEYSDQVF